MSQGPLCPNLSQKVQKEVSKMANHNLSPVILLGGLSVNLNHLKMAKLTSLISSFDIRQIIFSFLVITSKLGITMNNFFLFSLCSGIKNDIGIVFIIVISFLLILVNI